MGIIGTMKERRSSRYNADPSTLANPAAWLLKFFGIEPTASGIQIDEDSAMGLSAFWCGVHAISTDIAKLPFGVYVRRGKARIELPDDPVAVLMGRWPNPESIPFAFRKLMILYAILWGNGVAEIEWANNGRPLALWPQHPRDVNITRERTGKKRLIFEIKSDLKGGRTVALLAEDVFHLFAYSFDGVTGVSVVKYARESLGYSAALDRFGASYFGNNCEMGGVLQHPKHLSDGGKRLTESIEKKHKGPGKSRRLLVLEEGMTYQRIGVPPEDGQFLESRQFQVPEIARWLRMPPHKLMDLLRGTFSNIEHQSIEYVGDCLGGWICPFEQETEKKFFGKTDARYARHNVAGLLRADTKARYEAHQIARLGGWACVDDIREKEDMDPLPDGQGQVYLSPANMIPANRLDEMTTAQIEGKATPPAPANPPPNNPKNGNQNRASLDQVLQAQRVVLSDAFARALRVETDKIGRAAKREADFGKWSDAFFKEHRDAVRGYVFPFAESVSAIVAAAGGITIDAANLALAIADRHVSESRSNLATASGAEAIAAAVSAFEKARPEAGAAAEIADLLKTINAGDKP